MNIQRWIPPSRDRSPDKVRSIRMDEVPLSHLFDHLHGVFSIAFQDLGDLFNIRVSVRESRYHSSYTSL